MKVGEVIGPHLHKLLIGAMCQAAGDLGRKAADRARERLAVLAPRGLVTEALLTFLAKLAALSPRRCQRCLGPTFDRSVCRSCWPIHLQELDEARAPQPLAAGTEPAAAPVEIGPPPALVLDQVDRDELARSCASKDAYPSEIDAIRSLRKCEGARGVKLRAYHCWPGCGGWHLTKQLAVPAHVAARSRR